MSFVITKNAYKTINTLFKRQDYYQGEKKINIASDFIAVVDGKHVNFFAAHDASAVFTLVQFDFPESDIEKYMDKFENGIIPIASFDLFSKILDSGSHSDFFRFKYNAETAIIEVWMYGDEKELEFDSITVPESKSYEKYQSFLENYDITSDIPVGHILGSGEEYKLNQKVVLPANRISTIVKDADKFDARLFFLKIMSGTEAVLKSQLSNANRFITTHLAITSEQFLPVEREVGFGFTQLCNAAKGNVDFFYPEDLENEDIFNAVFRNKQDNLVINGLIIFDEPQEESSIQTSEDLDNEDFDIDEDEFDDDSEGELDDDE